MFELESRQACRTVSEARHQVEVTSFFNGLNEESRGLLTGYGMSFSVWTRYEADEGENEESALRKVGRTDTTQFVPRKVEP